MLRFPKKDFTYLQIIPVILENGNASIQTNALLDSGSDITLIHQKMVLQLKLKMSFKENLKYQAHYAIQMI